jgi:hypothetical protein
MTALNLRPAYTVTKAINHWLLTLNANPTCLYLSGMISLAYTYVTGHHVGPKTAIQQNSIAAAAAPVAFPGVDSRPVKAAMKTVWPIAPAISQVRRPSFSM